MGVFWDAVASAGPYAKQSASRSRQITTTTPHHSIFTGRVLFLMPNLECQSTEGKWRSTNEKNYICKYLLTLDYIRSLKVNLRVWQHYVKVPNKSLTDSKLKTASQFPNVQKIKMISNNWLQV